MNRPLTNDEIKESVIYVLNSYCQRSGNKIVLPIPVKAIAKSFKESIRVITFSRLMKDFGLSLDEAIAQCNTDDAYTDFDANSGTYIIYYNDITPSKISSNRYRWNIAHELGHIFLNHHTNWQQTKLFRSKLSDKEYRQLENEADRFAAYLLVPHILISLYKIQSKVSMMEVCKISKPAAERRYDEYTTWTRRLKSSSFSTFDKAIWKLASGTVECKTCKSVLYGIEERHFCKICGKKLFYSKESCKMIYSSIELDENKKPIKCPQCENEQLPEEGGYCQICGLQFYNVCSDQYNTFDSSCSYAGYLDGDARYCPYCGSATSYLQNGILKPYKEEMLYNVKYNSETFE